MKKFKVKVTIPLYDVQGYLRYGHVKAIVEAETAEEAEEKVKEGQMDWNYIEVDDYEIGDFEFDEMKAEPYED